MIDRIRRLAAITLAVIVAVMFLTGCASDLKNEDSANGAETNESYEKAIINMAEQNMRVQPGESVLVVTDVPDNERWNNFDSQTEDMIQRAVFAQKVYEILQKNLPENQLELVSFYATGRSGVEPPEYVAQKMMEHDVVFIITTFSLTHTNARQEANDAGTRIASMPLIMAEMFGENGPMAVDYNEVAAESERLAAIIDNGKQVRLETSSGTSLTFSIEGRAAAADTGLITEKGDFGNLPSGEACTAPVEGTAEGTLVISAGWHSGLSEDMIFTFEKGLVTKVEKGGQVGDYYRELLFSSDSPEDRRNLAELGIGTNPKATQIDNVLEAEKIKGTVHIALGDSSHLGGNVASDFHDDFILNNPRLYIDDVLVEL